MLRNLQFVLVSSADQDVRRSEVSVEDLFAIQFQKRMDNLLQEFENFRFAVRFQLLQIGSEGVVKILEQCDKLEILWAKVFFSDFVDFEQFDYSWNLPLFRSKSITWLRSYNLVSTSSDLEKSSSHWKTLHPTDIWSNFLSVKI
jgi:hypothetical protein